MKNPKTFQKLNESAAKGFTLRRTLSQELGFIHLRGVGRCVHADRAAYPTTPYPLRWAWPGTHPTRTGGMGRLVRLPRRGERQKLHSLTVLPRPSPSAGARAASRTTRGSGSRVCAGSTKSVLERGFTTQACSVAPPQQLAMGKRFPPAEKK